MKTWFKRLFLLVLGLGIAGAAAAWYLNRSEDSIPSFRTSPVERGDLAIYIAATGTVEPEEVIDVGAQVAGQILAFGVDEAGQTIDYGSNVKAGMVLARIDDSLYVADEAQAEAGIQQAKAGELRAAADMEQAKAKFLQAQRDWDRARKLGPSEALAQTSYDAYQSAFETAQAGVSVADAAVEQAKAQTAQADAVLQRAKRNLGYCTIKSPVDGVIIDRRVNIGQTVVASLNAPSLFLIAKDLRRMEVWVSVNEADIGSIAPGQPVDFTVDAFPDIPFHGEVGKIRLNAAMTQNVVTYTVVVTTDNAEGKLLPYLTANVDFEIDRRPDVLQVPNAALRWAPHPDWVAPAYRSALASPNESGTEPAFAADKPPGEASAQGRSKASSTVWVLQGDRLKPLEVKVGKSNGTMTEVSGTGLAKGEQVVIGEREEAASDAVTTTPFTPNFRRGGSSNRQEGEK